MGKENLRPSRNIELLLKEHSEEEVVALLEKKAKELEEENKKLQKENKKLIKETESLKNEFYYQRLMIEELLKIVEKKDFQRVSQVLRNYGIKSEKTTTLVNEAEVVEETSSKKEKEEAKKFEKEVKEKAKPGRKKGTKNLSNFDMSNVEVKDEYVASSDEVVCSSCGKTMIENGESIVTKLIYHPGTFEIINYHIKNYICPLCKEKEVDKNVDIFNENLVSPSLASHIINFKYNYAIPLYRQEDIFKRDGLPISRVSLSKYIELSAEALTPLYELMIKDLVSTDSMVLQADETSFKCIMDCQAEDGSKERDKNYVYTYATTYHDSPIRIYSYSKKRTADDPLSTLKNFKGYLECDGYEVYNQLPNVKIANCWAHARRKYADIVKTLTEKQKKNSTAFKLVKMINKLFKIEEDARKRKLSHDELLKLRQQFSKPIVDEYFTEIKLLVNKTADPLLGAINYSLNLEDGLRQFLNDGHIPLDNNLSERTVKPFVIMRKNALFSYSKLGAVGSCILMSIVQTAKENFLDVYKYLTYVLEKLNTIKTSELKDLLPYSCNLPKELFVKVK